MENKQETKPDSKAKVTVTQREAVAIYFAGFVYHRSNTREKIDHSTRCTVNCAELNRSALLS